MKTMIKIIEYTDYIFILAPSNFIFDYYNVKQMHGLKYGDKIYGWNNFAPDGTKPYIYINSDYIKGDYTDITLIQHEATHMGFKKYNWDADKEEEIITYGEEQTNIIYEDIKDILNAIRN